MIKIGGTFVIAFIYGVEGHFEKAWMLIKFRFWITTGFVTRPPKN